MELTASVGVTALINICISFACIICSWWILLKVKVEIWPQVSTSGSIRALLVLLAIAIGHQIAGFLINYLDWSRLIGQALF